MPIFYGMERKEKYLQSKAYMKNYDWKVTVFISNNTRFELKRMDKVISNPKQYNLGTPIAHLVQRKPDFFTYGDVYLEVRGRFSDGKFGGIICFLELCSPIYFILLFSRFRFLITVLELLSSDVISLLTEYCFESSILATYNI